MGSSWAIWREPGSNPAVGKRSGVGLPEDRFGADGRVSMNPEVTKDRAIGALLGLAVGDAVGTTLEFTDRDSYHALTDMVGGGPFGLSPGQWTDDTSMALCLADSLLACGTIDQKDLMIRFVRWLREGENSCTGRCFDIGNTVGSALA